MITKKGNTNKSSLDIKKIPESNKHSYVLIRIVLKTSPQPLNEYMILTAVTEKIISGILC